MMSCSHYLRLYWHRLLRLGWRFFSHYLRLCMYRLLWLGWRFSVTIWGYACIGYSGLGDVFQSLPEAILASAAQAWVTSSSHCLRLYSYRSLRLGWRLSVITWSYACIGYSGLDDVFQSLPEAILALADQAWVTSFSHCLRLYCHCAKLQRT